MAKKAKFKPIVTKIELNPEQAVLFCQCVTTGLRDGSFGFLGYSFCAGHGPQGKYMAYSFTYATGAAVS